MRKIIQNVEHFTKRSFLTNSEETTMPRSPHLAYKPPVTFSDYCKKFTDTYLNN